MYIHCIRAVHVLVYDCRQYTASWSHVSVTPCPPLVCFPSGAHREGCCSGQIKHSLPPSLPHSVALQVRAEKDALAKKLKSMESKIMKGESKGGLDKVTKKKEEELRRKEEELEKR